MRKKIDNNNLMPWFMDDHRELPASYLKSCEKFFKETSNKHQAASTKRQASSDLTRVEGYCRMKNPLQVMRPTSRGPARAKTNKGEIT